MTFNNLLESHDILEEHEEVAAVTSNAAADLPKLPWLTNYQDPQLFKEGELQPIYALFNEISHQKNVSDVIISPGLPVIIKVKRKGLFAITKRTLDYLEAASLVRVITNNQHAISTVKEGMPLSGIGRLIQGDVVDLHAAETYVEYAFQRKTRYRYEIVGSSSAEQESSFSMVLRPIPSEPPVYSDLNIPLDFVNDCIVTQGIVIIGGATGEGKTTLLSSIIRYILENDTQIKGNIITHEDPIEIAYDLIKSQHSYVTQSAIGPHIKTFDLANSAAMRRSSDLILVGELRDNQSVDKAVELSLTGHPVFATTHASNVSAILPRLLSRFPKEMQTQKCFDIIEASRVFASQKLIWTTDGKIMAVREHLKFTPPLRAYLKRYTDDPTIVARKISGIMARGLFGVVNFEMQGRDLLQKNIINVENYRHLVDATDPLDKETLEALDEC
ncbi:hypothetical protein B0181_07950 [Moraxella caviae]|uniref:Twitching mobility protein n=1 Tax=Moraxella caviae TaxID=34060 RepID=A0A1S9ZYU8_9GAMM|nr:ATPase, T2SS/T4P/T4SS family [Moraxella caviae]OOR88640.1 hypothetical protein B0181_07950 [Moraxella caviae]STZ13676.1 Twitching mobility protein [Moraxella caviae]